MEWEDDWCTYCSSFGVSEGEFDPCSCNAAIDLSRILQAQESRPGTIASCMLEMSYLVEVLKEDQVDCPVEPPLGAVQHKLTFIPIHKEDLYECVQTIHTVLLLEIDRLNLVLQLRWRS